MPPTGSTIPLTGIYKEKQALAEKAYQEAIAAINENQGKLMRTYGYTGDFDQNTGQMKNYRMDAGNRYGLFQQLGENYGQGLEAGEDEVLSRGLSTRSGLGAQGLGRMRQDYDLEQTKLSRGFLDDVQGLTRERLGARSSLSQQLLAAQQEAIAASINERLFTPTNVPAEPAPTGGGGAPLVEDPFADLPGGSSAPPPAAPPAPGSRTPGRSQDLVAQGGLWWGGSFFTTQQQFKSWLNAHGSGWNAWLSNPKNRQTAQTLGWI